jgi:hypothetical protein
MTLGAAMAPEASSPTEADDMTGQIVALVQAQIEPCLSVTYGS